MMQLCLGLPWELLSLGHEDNYCIFMYRMLQPEYWLQRVIGTKSLRFNLHWFPFCFQAQPRYWYWSLKPYMAWDQHIWKIIFFHTHPPWSSSEELLWVSLASEARWMTTQRRAFSVIAPEVWNSLLREVCLPLSLSFASGWFFPLGFSYICLHVSNGIIIWILHLFFF